MSKCAGCSAEFTPRIHKGGVVTKFCSRACGCRATRLKALGEGARGKPPSSFKCPTCGKAVKTYNREKIYCSTTCSGIARRGTRMPPGRSIGCKDKNHDELVSVFRQLGCSVFETHVVGGGFPDLIVGAIGETHLVEVKNLENYYGRKGLNGNQRHFAETWRGGPVFVVSTPDEVAALVGNWRRGSHL